MNKTKRIGEELEKSIINKFLNAYLCKLANYDVKEENLDLSVDILQNLFDELYDEKPKD